MNKHIIDTHIHLDQYEDKVIKEIIETKYDHQCEALLSVSTDLQSCKRNLKLKHQYKEVFVAFGYHPEQKLNSDEEFADLLAWIEKHHEEMSAVGEIGLPYYLEHIEINPYIERLEQLLQLAVTYKKPVNLHAVHDCAPIVCDLLERYSIKKAHFHWFKGDERIISRIQQNQYYISITPDIMYKEKIQQLANRFPIEQLLVETDGPWPFEDCFTGIKTHPRMIHDTIHQLSKLKQLPESYVYNQIYSNTLKLYQF